MEDRLRHSIHVAVIVLCVLMFPSGVASADPAPTPTAVERSLDTVLPSGAHEGQKFVLGQDGPQGHVYLGREADAPGTPSTPAPSPPAPAKLAVQPSVAPPPPPCGYYALSPEELASSWAWAGAEQANTGTLVPGRFNSANNGFEEAGIPADKVALGVQPYWFRCNGQQRLVFVPTPAPPAAAPPNTTRGIHPGLPFLEVASKLEGEIRVPTMAVGLNPAQFGITGFESYFWVAGYDGQPILQPATGTPGTSGWLRATPTYYRWSFGDGYSVTTTSLGEAYPKVSPITHTYDVRSDWSPMAAPNNRYHVSVTAYFDVSFQVSVPGQTLVPNGTWIEFSSLGLPPLQATVTQDYKVIEVVSQLVG